MHKKYQMVNWVDGMKIKKQHFIEQQHAFTQQLTDSAAAGINAVNYGLLLPRPGGVPSCKLSINLEQTNTLHVKVFQCRALTAGGSLIDIGEENGQPVHFSAEIPSVPEGEEEFMLVVYVDPFEPVPSGEADPEEVPPRHPYVKPDYRLALLPRKQARGDAGPGDFHLSIAEIRIAQGKATLAENYIPPCRAVYSFPGLIDAHTHFYDQLARLEALCIQIIQKILVKDQQYMLAHIVRYITENMLTYLNSMMYRFNWQLRYEPPLGMVACIANLGRIIKNAIDTRQGTGKEELINYFVEWCDLNQAQFEKVVSEVVDLVYLHTAIHASVGHCSNFLSEIVNLYSKLNELDYIGRKTEKDIFVKEEEFREGSQSKSKKLFRF